MENINSEILKQVQDDSKKNIKKLVLIDGNAIIHRAYHALPKSMATRKGEQTNAVYGFTTTIIKVLEDLNPDHIACSFDLAGPTFRHEQYAEYKATRVKADQDLYDQIPRVRQVVETMNIPIYEMAGFEADDVLGTIVRQVKNATSTESVHKKDTEKNRIDIYIVSGDKDIYQLINGNVFVYSLRKGLSQMQVVDHETIQKEYGLDPEDFIDLKALAGDPSDNIPGVPGIGPKTAIDLIQRFDTLQNLYNIIAKHLEDVGIILKAEFIIAKHTSESDFKNLLIEEFIENWKLKIVKFAGELEVIAKELNVKPRILGLLISFYPQALLSQHLATIHRDVPIEFSLEDAKWGGYDKEELKKLFLELGFQSLLRRFDAGNEKSEIRKLKSEVEKKDEQLKLL